MGMDTHIVSSKSKFIISDIKKVYEDFELNVSFEIEKGEFLTILGPSGSGKSTILKLIAGFEPIDQGRITMFGRDITYIDPSKRNMGIVFQDYTLFPHLNVFDNIAYGLKVKKLDKNAINEKVHNILDLLNMENYIHRMPHTLSGGEQQRVSIARALVINPELFLMDEPFSSLDTNLRKSIRREISDIQRKLNITTIFVTHNQEEALSISDKILLIKNGNPIQFGKPKELYENPINEFSAFFLGEVNIINKKMIRPEDISISKITGKKPKIGMVGNIHNIEYYGSYYQIYIDSKKYGRVVSRITDINGFKIGEMVNILYE